MSCSEPSLFKDIAATLKAASAQGDLLRVRELISGSAITVDRDAAVLEDAVYAAASHGKADVVAYLFDLGLKCNNGAFLASALRGGLPDTFATYIQHGWDVNTVYGGIGPVLR